MLRQNQEQEQAESEVERVRRKWSWFRERKTDVPSTEQTEADPVVTDEIEPRLTALQQAIERRKKYLRTTSLGAGAALAGMASILLTLPALARPIVGSLGYWLSFGLLIGGEALVIASCLRGEKAVRVAANVLASTEDLRAVGPLAEALMLGEPTYSLAVSALTHLLPRLQPSNAEMLNETQRACLRRALEQSSNRLRFWRYNPHFADILRRALTTLDALPATERTADNELIEQRPPDVEALLQQFQAAVRQRNKNMTTVGVAAMLSAVTAFANILTMPAHPSSPSPLLGVAIGSLGIVLGLYFRGLTRLKGMMNELANAGDLRVAGPLIEIATIQDGNANMMAALLLTRLLPRLRASDATLLTDKQRAELGRTLTSNVNNPDFLVAVLKALEQVGDGRALSVVESLAAGKIKTADPKRVQTAAQDCLPFLQARYDQQQASQTLLRASAISEMPSDTLLRPAHGVAATDDAELLRPGTPPSESEEEQTQHDERAWFTLPQPLPHLS